MKPYANNSIEMEAPDVQLPAELVLATNQGVVGSNPAGRANSALNSMACKQLSQAIFFLCAIEPFFSRE